MHKPTGKAKELQEKFEGKRGSLPYFVKGPDVQMETYEGGGRDAGS